VNFSKSMRLLLLSAPSHAQLAHENWPI